MRGQKIARPVERRLRVGSVDGLQPGECPYEGEKMRRVQECDQLSQIMIGIGIRLAIARQTMIVEKILECGMRALESGDRKPAALFRRGFFDVEEIGALFSASRPGRFR